MGENDELVNRMNFLRKRIMTLEWDKQQNQLNAGMEAKLMEFRKELIEVTGKVNQLKVE